MSNYLGIEPVYTRPFYFLSYNSEDQTRVKEYAVALAEKGVPLWYDEGIEIGSQWERSIATHIKDCETVIMFLSKGIFQKNESFVHKEFELAREYFDKRVIVILLDNILKRDVPTQYAIWWINVTQLQCINAWNFNSVSDCAERIAHVLGITATPAIKPKNLQKKQYNNGVYEGEIVNGRRHGKGTFTWNSGEIYVGEFTDDKRTGKGTLTWPSGEVYIGDFIDGHRTGKGKYTWNNGTVYEGDFVDDKRTGKGTLSWTNGTFYEGDFIQGVRTGKGKLSWATGDVYEGDFADDKRSGKGIFTWASGDVYEGDFADDKRTGKGKLTWVSGSVYEGDFVDNALSGIGTYISSDGKTFQKGLWKNDKFVEQI